MAYNKCYFSDNGSYVACYDAVADKIDICSVNLTNLTKTVIRSVILSNIRDTENTIPFTSSSSQSCFVDNNGIYLIISCPSISHIYFIDATNSTLLQTITDNQTNFGSKIAIDENFYGMAISTYDLTQPADGNCVRSLSKKYCSKINYYKRNFESSSIQIFKKIHTQNADAWSISNYLDDDELLNQLSSTLLPLSFSGIYDTNGIYRTSDIKSKKDKFAQTCVGLEQDQLSYNAHKHCLKSPRYVDIKTSAGFTPYFYGDLNYYTNPRKIRNIFYTNVNTANEVGTLYLESHFSLKNFCIALNHNNKIINNFSIYTVNGIQHYRNSFSVVNPQTGFTTFEHWNGTFAAKAHCSVMSTILENSLGDQIRPNKQDQIQECKICLNDNYVYSVANYTTNSNIKNIRVHRYPLMDHENINSYQYTDYYSPDSLNANIVYKPSKYDMGMIKILHDGTSNSTLNEQLQTYHDRTTPFLNDPTSSPNSQFSQIIDSNLLNQSYNCFVSNDYLFISFDSITLIFKILNNGEFSTFSPSKPLRLVFTANYSVKNDNFYYSNTAEYFINNNIIKKFNRTTGLLQNHLSLS